MPSRVSSAPSSSDQQSLARGHEMALGGVALAVEDSLTVADTSSYPFEVTGEHPDRVARVTALSEVIEVIRPVIASDGGSLDVIGVDVEAGVVRLQLSGACGSCAVSAATLNDGINRILRDRLSWITEVIGGIEESDISGMGGWTPKHS